MHCHLRTLFLIDDVPVPSTTPDNNSTSPGPSTRSPSTPPHATEPPTQRSLPDRRAYTDVEMRQHATQALAEMSLRRTVRDFDDTPVPEQVIRDCIAAASTAPSGAHRQPWHFVAVRDGETKRLIREAAEEEERTFYGGRAPDDWLEALAPFNTDANKPFLETAPWLIAVFAERWGTEESGERRKNYYVQESVGIAVGMLLTALHRAGLATLTHTPSPMDFLRTTLGRPENERAFVLIVTGRAADGCTVPAITRKSFDDVATIV
ncbi:MAG: iodotyrosine deiodinase [Bradymonadia bacterium]|jgi:iodotyrosine deiodinase